MAQNKEPSLPSDGDGNFSPTEDASDESSHSSSEDNKETSRQPYEDPYSDEFTESAARKPFHERLRHFLQGRVITEKNRAAVETTYLCEAGRIVYEDERMKESKRGNQMIEDYKKLVSETPANMFYNDELREAKLRNFKGGHKKTGFKPTSMILKWNTYSAEMRRIVAHLPSTYHTIKSGMQLYNMHDKMIVQYYKEANVSIWRLYLLKNARLKSLSLCSGTE